jgi:hypothetical protein
MADDNNNKPKTAGRGVSGIDIISFAKKIAYKLQSFLGGRKLLKNEYFKKFIAKVSSPNAPKRTRACTNA